MSLASEYLHRMIDYGYLRSGMPPVGLLRSPVPSVWSERFHNVAPVCVSALACLAGDHCTCPSQLQLSRYLSVTQIFMASVELSFGPPFNNIESVPSLLSAKAVMMVVGGLIRPSSPLASAISTCLTSTLFLSFSRTHMLRIRLSYCCLIL